MTLYVSYPGGTSKFEGATAHVTDNGVLEIRQIITFGPKDGPPEGQTWKLIAAFKEWRYWKYLQPKANEV